MKDRHTHQGLDHRYLTMKLRNGVQKPANYKADRSSRFCLSTKERTTEGERLGVESTYRACKRPFLNPFEILDKQQNEDWSAL